MVIELLCDNPHLVPAVSEIRWKEWGHPPEPEDLDWWIDSTRREAGRDTLPVTWVAIDDFGQAVGAVGLDWFDLPERRDHSPWIVGMIIAPSHRNRGIGGQLLVTLEQWVKSYDYSQAWVATGKAIAFYQKYGWRLVESVHRSSDEVLRILTKVM